MSGDPTSSHAPAKTPFRLVRCPTCKGDSVYASTNPFRPFCSDRCKNADFGAWATESYRIDAKPTLEDDMDSSAVPDAPSDH